jgi:hypothetical protein
MTALGNPNEPLPELPEWGIQEGESTAEVTPPDRMRELLGAMEEAGLLKPGALAEPVYEDPELRLPAHEASQLRAGNGHVEVIDP